MKATVFLLALAVGLAPALPPLRADDPVAPPAPAPPPAGTDHPIVPTFQRVPVADNPAVPAAQPVQADDPVVPGAGFSASRYEALWTKSPFAVATPDVAVDTSPDYMLVGFAANVGGVSYASLIDAHNQEHFLISTDKPNRGLTLGSITRSHDGADTFASVLKDGQTLTLKLEQPPASAPVAGANMPPGGMTPQISMPGGAPSFSNPGAVRLPTRFHRTLINLPPRPAPQPAPVQVHPAPPQ
jgi:hypothetical protein